jgi:cytochrome c biogenesis protein
MIGYVHFLAYRFASLWLTLFCLVASAVIAVTSQMTDIPIGTWMALPFGILCLNLLAAIAVTPKLRFQAGLLGFHLALAALALMAAVDQLVALSGHVEITEGTAFDVRLVEAETGPLHSWQLDHVRFVQGEIDINYAPGMKRRDTRSTVYLPGADDSWRKMVVGDDNPVVVSDYRFYTTFNKGFAPVITYVDDEGSAHTGAVHLPSYPLNFYKQGNDWALPGGEHKVKLWLRIPDPVYAEDNAWRFGKPKDTVLVVIDGEQRHELRAGERLPIGSGTLRYEELRSWMGYTISYNPLAPWMMAAVVVAILCLGVHMTGKFARRSWVETGSGRAPRNAG